MLRWSSINDFEVVVEIWTFVSKGRGFRNPLFMNGFGDTFWAPAVAVSVSCKMSVQRFPFDAHSCSVKFVSMLHDADEVVFEPEEETVNTDLFAENGEFELTSTRIKKYIDFKMDGLTLSGFQIDFNFTRRPTVTVMTVIVPVAFVSSISIAHFVIPGSYLEKIAFGMTVLLGIFVNIQNIASFLPKTEPLPILTLLIFSLMCLTTVTLLYAIAIACFKDRAEKEKEKQKIQHCAKCEEMKDLKEGKGVSAEKAVVEKASDDNIEEVPCSDDATNVVNMPMQKRPSMKNYDLFGK
ncbi:neuronal acetylcholine receptor subunit beta-2-like [Physella acuta]|uniref:neuronal acetylcholine receptor subunit beta-2-like n=1 Tax=Physella acuta TaxID=109671 RepID=UPI0027DDF609|nr:neuronal acetylcholine receptor subunit beta-2-like [Physella acuta]